MADTTFVDGETLIEAAWLNDVNDAIYNPAAAIIPASSIVNTPAGNIVATDVQAALNELDTDKATVVHVHAGTDITSGVVALANGGTGQATAALAFAALKQAASDTATGVVELATSAEVITGTSTSLVVTPAGFAAANIVSDTAQATTTGSSKDFTIPSTAKRIDIFFASLSSNGTVIPKLQLGVGGVLETTNYLCGAAGNGVSTNSTTGFIIAADWGSTTVIHGCITLRRISGNIWVASGSTGRSDNTNAYTISGSKTLAGTLNKVSIVTTDTLDLGSINAYYE